MTIEEKVEVSGHRMPQFTVCSAGQAYKKPGFHFNQTSFDQNTFDFNDFFQRNAKEILASKVHIKISKVYLMSKPLFYFIYI